MLKGFALGKGNSELFRALRLGQPTFAQSQYTPGHRATAHTSALSPWFEQFAEGLVCYAAKGRHQFVYEQQGKT